MTEPPPASERRRSATASTASGTGPALARRARKKSLLGQLESLRKQSGAIVGEIYALTARSLLKRLETIEDLEAERRFRQRKSRSPRTTASPGAAPGAETSPLSPKTSA